MLRATRSGLLLAVTLQMVMVARYLHSVLLSASFYNPCSVQPQHDRGCTAISGDAVCVLVVGRVGKVCLNVCSWKLNVFERVCSWLRWCRRWVGCDSLTLPILLLLSDRLWCQIWLVIDSGSCAVVCQQRPHVPPSSASLPAIFGSHQIPWFIQPFFCIKDYLSDGYWQVIHI